MAQNKVVIDVEARFIDNVTPGAAKAQKAIDKLDGKKPKVVIDADTGKAGDKLDDVDDKLTDIGKKRPKPVVDVIDRAKDKIVNVLDKARSFANRVYSGVIRIRDSNVLSVLSQIGDKALGLTRNAWTMVVRVKDLALSPLTLLKNTIFNIKTLIAGIFAGAAAQKLVAQPVALADAYSSAKIGFSTLLGEAQGQKMMDDLDAFAKATPFKTSEVIANTQKMIAMGWQAENIIEDMTTIGDAAAATGKGDEGLNRIVLALAQIKSKGKLSTEELNQLAEAGISAKRYLAEGLGYGTGDEALAKLAKDLQGGKVGADKAVKAIMAGMKEYEGMMDRTANETVSGLFSQIEDTFEINIFRRWGQGLQEGAKRGFGSVISLLDTAEEGLEGFGDLLYDVGRELSTLGAEKLEKSISTINELVKTDEFQNADILGKIKILWDGVVADPIKEWWENGGQKKAADTASKVGRWIGTAISSMWTGIFKGAGYLTDGDVAGEGANIAESFVRGFLDGFDGNAIKDAFIGALDSVWNAMPTWAKFLIGGYATSKAIGGIQALAGGITSVVGTIGSAAQGTGILGWGANTAIGMGAGNLAGGATMSAGALSAVGLGATAGGIAGGYGVLSGINDLVSSGKSRNKGNTTMANAEETSGSVKLLTAGGGAAAGAAIGAAFGGIGAIPGALIGAGLGAVAGIFTGNKIKKNAAEGIQSMKDLEKAAESSEDAAEELLRRQDAAVENLNKHFGDLSLTYSEVQTLAKNLTLGNKAAAMAKFSEAASTAAGNLITLRNSAESVNKWNWKAGLGFRFDETDTANYKQAVDNYISAAKEYVESQHYEFTAAVTMLVKPNAKSKDTTLNGTDILASADSFYKGLQEKLNKYNKRLTKNVDIALKDGKITADEQKIIEKYQKKIASITNKLSKAQTEAEMQTIKIKFSSGQLDLDSFRTMQSELQKQIESSTQQYDTALTTSITSLNLELQDGAIDQKKYDAQVEALTKGYVANVEKIKANAANVQFEILGDAYGNLLGDDAMSKLQSALEQSITDGLQPVDWTVEQAKKYLGVDKLSEGAALAIGSMLSAIAETIPPTDVTVPLNTAYEAVEGSAEKAKKTVDDTVEEVYPEETTAEISPTYKNNNPFNPDKNWWNIRSEYTESTRLKITVDKVYQAGSTRGSASNPVGGFRGGIFYPNKTVQGFSDGGIVRGGSRLIEVAEEGSPEMVIPLSSQRRGRALKLWAQAGHMMDVPGFARGGLTNGQPDEDIRSIQYGAEAAPGTQTVQVDVGGITIEVQVNGDGNGNITEAIRAQANDIADTVAGILADAFKVQFENTPTRGGAA